MESAGVVRNLKKNLKNSIRAHLSCVMRKTVFKFQHKWGCTATEDGLRLEISDLGRRGIVLCSENKSADQLGGYRAADLPLWFRKCKSRFSHDMAHFTFL